MEKYIIIVLLLLLNTVYAQNRNFITQGVIEYEKTVNMYAIIKGSINKDNRTQMSQTLEKYKSAKPQFKKLKSTLLFTKTQTLYSSVADDEKTDIDIPMIYQHNTTYTNLLTKNSLTQKKVYEQLFLVKDSVRNIKWKITDEFRDIAGYTCRRANALIMDSIYVVAFYTINIPVNGGPESFTGLPGMILGVALPHENVTWFANQVIQKSIQPTEITMPTKGQPVNNKTLVETLYSALKYWGEYANIAIKAFLL